MGLIGKIAKGLKGSAGGLLGGAITAVGGSLAARARNQGYNEFIKMYQNRMQQVKDHRDNLYYQDPTQSAENQVAVTNAQKVLNNATETAKNTNIVSGGSDEAVALSKQAAQEQVGNIMQQAAVQGAQNKENVWNTADSQIDTMTNYIAAAKKEKALSTAQGITDATGALAGAASKLPI
ncbi:hypothetical protein [Segatella sp.]|uniref:hypothetical protein n=1 Tax=Segatella sp. TaxID=2974253 RepID=UPI003078C68A